MGAGLAVSEGSRGSGGDSFQEGLRQDDVLLLTLLLEHPLSVASSEEASSCDMIYKAPSPQVIFFTIMPWILRFYVASQPKRIL